METDKNEKQRNSLPKKDERIELKLWLDVNRNFFWKNVHEQCLKINTSKTEISDLTEGAKKEEVREAVKSIYEINNYREFAKGNADFSPEKDPVPKMAEERKEPTKCKYEPEIDGM